jgi:hypothetical protein
MSGTTAQGTAPKNPPPASPAIPYKFPTAEVALDIPVVNPIDPMKAGDVQGDLPYWS